MVVGPHGPIVVQPAVTPEPPPPSSFPENLVELLPEYVPPDLSAVLPEVIGALAAATMVIPDQAVGLGATLARNAVRARNRLLEFLDHPAFIAMQVLMDDIGTTFKQGEFIAGQGLADDLGAASTDVPSIAAITISTAMRSDPIEFTFKDRIDLDPNTPGRPGPIVEVTLTLPGYEGPRLTETHRDQLLTYHDLLVGGAERTIRVGLIRAECHVKLGALAEGLGEYDALLSSNTLDETRRKYVAICAGFAHLALGDARYRGARAPDQATRDQITSSYAQAVAVVAANEVSASNPLRRHIERHAAAQEAKLDAGFNVLGFKDGYVPILQADYLRERALERIALAETATQRYLNFRQEANRLDDQEAQARLEADVADIASAIADERVMVASEQRRLASTREQVIEQDLADLARDTQLSMTPGVLVAMGSAVAGAGSTLIQSVEGVASAAIGYFARRNELQDQLRLARIESNIADREQTIARLEQELADVRRAGLEAQLKRLGNRLLNADLFYALSNLYGQMAERNLEAAIRWVYLYERAVAFKRVDFDLAPVELDYRREVAGRDTSIPAPDRLHELVTKIGEADASPTQSQLLEENPISLRTSYPIEFHRLLQTGETDFAISLYDLEKLRPGAYHRRLVRVRVEVTGLIPQTGFGGRIEHEGFFVLRDRASTLGPPAATRLLPTEERMFEALQNLQRGTVQGDPVDGVIFYLLSPNRQELSAETPPENTNPEASALALFEGHGETGRWHLEIDNIDLRLITDVLIYFRIKLPQSDGELQETVEDLLAAYEAEGGSEDLDKIALISLRSQFADAYDALPNGPGVFNLDEDDVPPNITELRVKTIVGQVVDTDGTGVAGVGMELSSVDNVFSMTRTTGDEGFTEEMDEAIPFVQPPEDRVPLIGRWEVRLTDQADFDRIDDVRLFVIYSYQRVP